MFCWSYSKMFVNFYRVVEGAFGGKFGGFWGVLRGGLGLGLVF